MEIFVTDNIGSISSNDWDSCAKTDDNGVNPFCSHGFLSALEESGCVNANTGWHPQHIFLKDDKGNIKGVMPLYLKSHSQGEYVFDHGWANAFEQAGGNYYPKLQSSIPFSPVSGPRLLSKDAELKPLLLEAAINHAKSLGTSSLHFTFLKDNEIDVMKSQKLLHRQDQQFHWYNQNYTSFNDFLNTLTSRKRKNIIKERRTAIANNIKIEILTGSEINELHWDHYFEFYLNTSNKKWGRPYLNREFFSLIQEKISEHIILIMAKRGGKFIAGALNLIGNNTLYGRYWGATEYHKYLHFELCYYQAIELAIKKNIEIVEAGAQGDHKISRGYVPKVTNSMHWIENQSFKMAIKKFLAQERKAVEREIDYLSNFTPFKKG